jgi:hypothetical protein
MQTMCSTRDGGHGARAPLPTLRFCHFHRRARRGFQEEVTMLELFILVAGFAGGYAASVYSWPWIRANTTGAGVEIARLRARAKALEDQIKGVL